MSRKFSFTVSYSVPVEELHRAITSDELWQARFAGAETATLDLSHPEGPGTIRIHMSEKARADKIPSIVSKVLKSELVLERTDNWGPLDGDTARGTFVGASRGITTAMEGAYLLRSTAEGSEIEVAGTVTVKVPLVGGAIEPLAEQLQHRVVNSERKFIEEWLSKAEA
ncbi:DUF2505 domain-containing protein [Nocardia transvalensis]|uniref:DUF2505 domain-containing protein n=1 Tax=Nocardia transvalensis TaxID=37333 RepID=UPI0018932A7E|nr:DUF2505 domain-containing protein [Nocardia transvalensis]MBF6333705.1 DUF2505 domain-containing protein [Nocardia transvalensis]